MEEQQIPPAIESKEKRPTLLTLLCILSFIGSGLNAFSNLMVFIFYDTSMRFAAEMMKSFKITGMDQFLDARPIYFAATALINALAIAGATLMWQLRKTGFHMYTVSQILVILAPMYFFRLPSPDLLSVLLSGIFIVLYSTTLKKMS